MNKIECIVCGHIFEDEDLNILGIRCDRHEQGRHQQHNVIGQRPYQGGKMSKSGMGGLILSNNVEWITHEC